MGLFSKPEVVIAKESSNAKEYLRQLEELAEKAAGENAKKIAKEIAVVKAGIIGEDNILFELKNSGMDMVVLHDLYIESVSGASAQIDFLVLTPKINFVLECKNLFGNIEINSKGDFIRTICCGGRYYKEGIYSPITQNQRHLQVLKEEADSLDALFIRFIVSINWSARMTCSLTSFFAYRSLTTVFGLASTTKPLKKSLNK